MPRLGAVSSDRQNLRLAHSEIDVERVGLDDGCERGRSGHADERADVDLMIGDDAIEGSEDPGIAKVDRRGFDVGLINQNGALVLLHDEGLVLRLLRCN